MFQSLRQICGNPQLLLLAFMTFIQGSAYGSVLPYLSITAIRELGMSDHAYSALVFFTSLSAVTVCVSLGVLSDLIGNRRRIMTVTALMGVAGYGTIFFFRSVPVFVVATAFVIPFFQSVSSLIFASVRAETAGLPRRDAAAINATVRAFLSAAWVVMPSAIGLAFAGSASMMGAWGVAGLCALITFFCSAFLMANPVGDAPKAGIQSGFFSALAELANPMMMARAISMAALTGTIRLASTLWPLILTVNLGGKMTDVGIIAGLIALLEIPFMLMWAALLKRLDIVAVLMIAGLIYASFMAGLTLANAPWQVYFLTLPAAAGASALLSMPLNYFQDLFPGKPGLGTSFSPVNSFLGNGMTALAFAIGANRLGYSATAWLGVTMAVSGIMGLAVVERRRSNRV